MISTGYLKDPTDPSWDNDAGMNEWRAFMAKIHARRRSDRCQLRRSPTAVSKTMLQVLQQCNGDFSRANIMKQATNLHDLRTADAAAGHQGEHQPDQLSPDQGDAVERWDGKTWVLFGDIIEATSS